MPSPAWQTYLFPHRSHDTPAVVRLILAGLSGVILSFSYRGAYLSLYSWFCLALLIASILRARPLVAFGCGFLHGVFFVVTSVPWIAQVLSVHGDMSLAAGWGVLLLIASIWGGAIGLFGVTLQRTGQHSMALALIATPFLWVATEAFRTFLPEISFPWSLLGYPTAGNPALVQLTTITGIYGLSFVVASFNALLIWSVSGGKHELRGRMTTAAGVLAVLLLVQWIGPRFVPRAEAHHIVRVVQPNFPENEPNVDDWYTKHKSDLAQLEKLSLQPSPSGQQSDLLIWPEAPAPFSFQDPRFGPYIGHLSSEFHRPIVAGVIEWKRNSDQVGSSLVPYNSAAMLNENGQRTFVYDKIHLVPFGEYEPFPLIHKLVHNISGTFHKGRARRVGSFSNGNTFSVFICYEAIYPGEVREFVNRGAQLLINISNDGWFGASEAAEQHLRMARVRAVENRRWLVRDTNSGVTASIDPYGNMTRVLQRDTRGAADLPYDFRADKAFYTRLNDWVAWMCVSVSGILIVATFRKAK